MGDAQGQSGLDRPVFFLDENHAGNPYLHAVFRHLGVAFEKHSDHFPRGTQDVNWIPVVARKQWVVLTADARIHHNDLERQAVHDYGLCLFYFSRNHFSGAELGRILGKALPRMLALCRETLPPFAASIARTGEVKLRDLFRDL